MIENLKQNIARMEEELADMKEQLSKQERNWPETIKEGMLFKHKNGDIYMTVWTGRDESLILAHFSAEDAGNIWSDDGCFSGAENDFTYIGMAKDKLRILD